ncbi:MAG: indole-3-glycerol-phosphate synthase [Myxococcales bacterium]|nr:indole-3-glycerol-phosphate synthase [Myxococcales bacterium]
MSVDLLSPILERKARENHRRLGHQGLHHGYCVNGAAAPRPDPAAVVDALRRRGAECPRVIAEIKLRSPSAGTIRVRRPGELQAIASAYASAGAAAISVLCDGPGFGGSPLDLRRVAASVARPVLFKEFVLAPLQLRLARAMGASLVLLLVRALERQQLRDLIAQSLDLGLVPLVEAADEAELELALATEAPVVGVNARDLKTFKVDPERALRAVAAVPADRVAVQMSGIASGAALSALGPTRADAVLVGEALMRAEQPGLELARWLGPAESA